MSIEHPLPGEHIIGHPCDKRIDDSRYVRHEDGCVSIYFGYYSNERQILNKILSKHIVDTSQKSG